VIGSQSGLFTTFVKKLVVEPGRLLRPEKSQQGLKLGSPSATKFQDFPEFGVVP
jgi:hypothetical protein